MRRPRRLLTAGFMLVVVLATQGLPAAAATSATTSAKPAHRPPRHVAGASQMTLAQAPIELRMAERSVLGPLSGTAQQAELTAADGSVNDDFGYSVALSGSTAVVGAPFKNSNTGAAYVFVRSGTAWSQQSKLTASDGAAGDVFGISVAISGSTAVVGAFGKSSNTGAAYVFVRSGTAWSQQKKLTASDGAVNDYFGHSVAISSSVSSSTVVVGADGKNSYAGAAYVFVRSGTAWAQQAKLTASDSAARDQFGYAVAMSGTTVVVGAYGKNSAAGAAYVFMRSVTAWPQRGKLTASDAASGDEFGWAVGISGSSVVVGAFAKNLTIGAAYVFVRSGTAWSQQKELIASDGGYGDEFGYSVAISGATAMVGAPGKKSAYRFVRSGTAWTQQAKLTAAGGSVTDEFAYSVAVSGSTAVVGAWGKNSNTGAAYVYVT